MFAPHPNPLPAEPGMIAIRLLEPVTPFERDLATTCINSGAVYRLLVWVDRSLFVSATVGSQPPEFGAVILDLAEFHHKWSEIVVST